MNIRKYIMIAAAAVSIAAFSSCGKEGLPFFRGTYGYVTSGSLSCTEIDGDNPKPSEYQLSSERGIMHIEGDDRNTILTMTSIGGEAVVFDAVIDGADITLRPQTRMVGVNVTSRSTVIPVTVQGRGRKTAGIIVLDLEYSGAAFTVTEYASERSYMISGSSVRCIATLQE